MNLIELVAGIFKPAAELIDELHTSEEERLAQKAHLLDVQATVLQKALDYELEQFNARSRIVEAEAKSEHWVTATWRPITMLTMLGLVVGDALSILPNPLSQEAFTLLQLGIGGYVVGRSAEKVIKTIKSEK